MTKVVVLGSTGSVGTQALDVVGAHGDRFEVVGLAAGSDKAALDEQAESFPAAKTALGQEGAIELAALDDADVVLNAIVGAAGLEASVTALASGKVLALANKESLVVGGRVCLDAAARGGGKIVPVDSEHAALAQCLEGRDRASIARIVLTASGGPFRLRHDLAGVTPDEALAHPTWAMGPKITVDCATLFNKGLEVIEAHFLFGFDYDSIDVVVHPESIVHGMVVMRDGSVLMQAAPTDMRIPIQAALATTHGSAPAPRLHGPGLELPKLDPELPNLSFGPVDHARFPAVDLAYDAGRRAQTYPAALNAANEVAVRAFLDGTLDFAAIPRIVSTVLDAHEPGDDSTLEAVLDADERARATASRLIGAAA